MYLMCSSGERISIVDLKPAESNSYLNDWCCVVDEQGFRSGLLVSANSSSNAHKNAHYSPLLHNAMLALATSRCSDIFANAYTSGQTRNLIDASAAAAAFMQRARWLIEEEAINPMTSTAKGLMLLGSCHNTVGSLSLGWFYEGMAVRMAQASESQSEPRNAELTIQSD